MQVHTRTHKCHGDITYSAISDNILITLNGDKASQVIQG